MPVHTGKDNQGCFAQWGSQKKYYYNCINVNITFFKYQISSDRERHLDTNI